MQERIERPDYDKAADIVRDAGGKVVGRTRLQKIAYLLEQAGAGDGFVFEYRHYGPYSDQLSRAVKMAELFDCLKEEEKEASWGGKYSVFIANSEPSGSNQLRRSLVARAAHADSIELELAATAVFLWQDGIKNPWTKTAERKPEKASCGRIDRARDLYSELRAIAPQLPAISNT